MMILSLILSLDEDDDNDNDNDNGAHVHLLHGVGQVHHYQTHPEILGYV